MSSEDFELAPMTSTNQKSYNEQVAEKFNRLTSINLNDKTESKNGLSYVSWANAWKAFKEVYPTATYRIIKDPQTNLPYFVNPVTGIMVFTEVSANFPMLSLEDFERIVAEYRCFYCYEDDLSTQNK